MVGKRKRAVKTAWTNKKRNNKKLLEKELKSAFFRDWAAGFPDHLLELVLKRLSPLDSLSFSSVCKSWKKITTKFFYGSSHGIPLLVTNGHDENIITRTCLNVLDKNKNKNKNSSFFEIKFPEACRGSYIHGSFQDWLFLTKNIGCYVYFSLLNPFSGERIELPKIFGFRKRKLVVSMVPNDPKCIFMLTNGSSDNICFWTRGSLRWRIYSLGYGLIGKIDALYQEGRFYLLVKNFNLIIIEEKNMLGKLNNVIDADDDSGSRFSRSPLIESQFFSLGMADHVTYKTKKVYLVESCGEILLVRHFFYTDCPRRHKTSEIEIYKADFSQMAWVRSESLGDQILFLGEPSSRSFSAKELGDDGLANSVYFSNNYTWVKNLVSSTQDYLKYREKGDDWGFFNFPKAKRRSYVKSNNWPGIWITAPIWWCSKERQHYR